MEQTLVEEQLFNKQDFTQTPLPKGEYDCCSFENCNFADADLSGISFAECTFANCNLSMTKVIQTAFRDAVFTDCKMLGIAFDACNTFGLSLRFEGCNLNHASFYKLKIKKTVFRNTQLHEVDFADSDLSSSSFDNCDLLNASFSNTNIEKSDFRTARNYVINPESNKIKKAKFSLSEISGLLCKYDITITR